LGYENQSDKDAVVSEILTKDVKGQGERKVYFFYVNYGGLGNHWALQGLFITKEMFTCEMSLVCQ
jgi:hypothetical protein